MKLVQFATYGMNFFVKKIVLDSDFFGYHLLSLFFRHFVRQFTLVFFILEINYTF